MSLYLYVIELVNIPYHNLSHLSFQTQADTREGTMVPSRVSAWVHQLYFSILSVYISM